MARYCSVCGATVGDGIKFCATCGALVKPREVVPPVPGAAPAPPAAGTSAPARPGSPRPLLLVAGGVLLVLIVVLVLAAVLGGSGDEGTGGAARSLSASHPSGLEVSAEVGGGSELTIGEIDVDDVELPSYLDAAAAWSIEADGALVGETRVTVPDPGLADFVLLAWDGASWVPVPFSATRSGDLEVALDAGQLDALALVPASTAVVAAAEQGLGAYGFLSELRLAVASIDVAGFLDELIADAGRAAGRLMGEVTSFANPPMCTRAFPGAAAERDTNAGALLEVCVEDRAGEPVVKIGNATRFALEVFPTSGVDIRHGKGGIDFGGLGGRGVVAAGGETIEWSMAAGSTATFAIEFTGCAFLRQVATWAIDLIPAGSKVLETGEDLAEAVSILKDALGIAGSLQGLGDDLYAGEYRKAFGDVASLLTQQAVIEELVDRGFFERLGYRLGEDTVAEVFSVLQLGGHLADLGSLLWTTWQTGGYVHGEAVVRLPTAVTTESSSTTTPIGPAPTAETFPTSQAPPTTSGGGTSDGEHLGSVTAGETPATFTFSLSDEDAALVAAGAARVLVAAYDAGDPDTTFKYGGWHGKLWVNGAVVYEWREFDGTDSLYWDAALGEEVYGRTGVGEWNDVSALVQAGDNEITYDHNNEGAGIGIKVRIER